jgi:hypothetical protein
MAAVLVSVAAILMVVAGAAKVVRPEPAANALGVLGIGAAPLAIRLGAGLEVLIGLAALVAPGPLAALALGASYLGFAAFVLVLRAKPGAESCGCFGADDEPPSLRHVVVDALLGAGCLLAAATGAASAGSLLRADWVEGAVFVVLSATAAWLVGLVLRHARWATS